MPAWKDSSGQPQSTCRGLRINVVSPGWITETLQAMGEDDGTSASAIAAAYRGLIEGTAQGRTVTPARTS